MSIQIPSFARSADGAATPREVARRRGLPNGRAVLGALLLTVAGVGTFASARAASDSDSTRYAVMVHAVAPGARISSTDVALRPMSLDRTVAGQAYTDTKSLVGAVALGPLASGQLLQRAEIATGPAIEGLNTTPNHELTIPVPGDRLPAGLRRGERVAILATYGTGADAKTIVTVQHAVVLGTGDADTSLTSRSATRLTLALTDPNDVVETAHAAQVADITIVRATLAAGELPATYSATAPTATAPATTPSPTTTAAVNR